MPSVKCPFDGCDYVTDDVEATIVVALLEAHTAAHKLGQGATKNTTAEAEKDASKFKPPTHTGRSKSETSGEVPETRTKMKLHIQICYKYNKDGCVRTGPCPYLHLCKAYIESKCDSGNSCSKSHNIHDPQVKAIMEEHGLDTKTKPQEILQDLQATVNDSKGKTKNIQVQGGARSAFNRSLVKICFKYNGDGCDKSDSCPYLHLCKGYLEGKCSSGKECSKSHNILEPHVKAIMDKYGIDTKRRHREILRDLQAAFKDNISASQNPSKIAPVKICYKYNCDGCDSIDSCPYLHLCKDYIENKCDSGEGCSKSHDILDSKVQVIMEKRGIDTKRNPMEILPDLQAAYKDCKVQGTERNTSEKSSIMICNKYNGDGCNRTGPCPYLHLCKRHIESKCESGESCSKSHNIIDPQLNAIIEIHGIDTKRKPEDILPDLQAAVKDSKANMIRRRQENPKVDSQNPSNISPVKICYKYNGNGCDSIDPCPYLHLCEDYIENKCNSGEGCSKSHDILDSKVKAIMEKRGIDTKRNSIEFLSDLQAAYKDCKVQGAARNTSEKSSIMICNKYNGDGCDRKGPCPYLHLCKRHIEGKCESAESCSKSHNIIDPQLNAIMEKHGIDTKRKPEDILPDLQAAVKDSKANMIRRRQENSEGADENTFKKSAPNICYNYNGRGCEKGNSCMYIHMCKSYIERKCVSESNCKRNHDILEPEVKAKLEKHGINTKRKPRDILADFQAAVREKNRKVNSATGKEEKDTINGRKPPKMSRKMVCHFNLRGICRWNFCPNIHCDLPYQWRWRQLSEKEWSNLGQHENLETEKAFCDPANQSYMLVTEQGVNMNIDFNTMIGTDLEGKWYLVHRLSTPSSVELTRQPWAAIWLWYWKNETGVWMKYGDTLKECDTECNEIKAIFLDSLGSTRTVQMKSIERIENNDLWENFISKRTKMMKKKTREEVGERRLFHGTRNQYIDPIWHQGFDFRLSGQTSGTVYGKGSYFATTSKYSNSYVEQTTDRAMFIVKALPGAHVRGNGEYKRPPHKDKQNPCSELYDSCVDSESNPQIFVIFDNNQIYPEYLIKYEYGNNI